MGSGGFRNSLRWRSRILRKNGNWGWSFCGRRSGISVLANTVVQLTCNVGLRIWRGITRFFWRKWKRRKCLRASRCSFLWRVPADRAGCLAASRSFLISSRNKFYCISGGRRRRRRGLGGRVLRRIGRPICRSFGRGFPIVRGKIFGACLLPGFPRRGLLVISRRNRWCGG